jgi:hypothetical protein
MLKISAVLVRQRLNFVASKILLELLKFVFLPRLSALFRTCFYPLSCFIAPVGSWRKTGPDSAFDHACIQNTVVQNFACDDALRRHDTDVGLRY